MKSFTYSGWKVTCKTSDKYRDYVLLKQLYLPVKKKVPLIMLNPGSFICPKTFAKDTTLRKIREVFLDSGYEIEILNLFNVAEPKSERLDIIEEKNKRNPIFERLRLYPEGSKVIIQWGKLSADFKKRAKETLQFIEKGKLIPIGLKDEKGDYYCHPLTWNIKKYRIKEFKKKILPLIQK